MTGSRHPIWMAEALWAAIKAAAKREGISANEFVRRASERALEAYLPKERKP